MMVVIDGCRRKMKQKRDWRSPFPPLWFWLYRIWSNRTNCEKKIENEVYYEIVGNDFFLWNLEGQESHLDKEGFMDRACS